MDNMAATPPLKVCMADKAFSLSSGRVFTINKLILFLNLSHNTKDVYSAVSHALPVI